VRVASSASLLSHVRVSCLDIGLHWTKSFQCLTSRGESSRRLLPRVRPWQTQVRPWQRQAAATRKKPSEMIVKAMHLPSKRMQTNASVYLRKRLAGHVGGGGMHLIHMHLRNNNDDVGGEDGADPRRLPCIPHSNIQCIDRVYQSMSG